jgi:ABC-type nitrate/sulfonate/bicarbonate transport system permease component
VKQPFSLARDSAVNVLGLGLVVALWELNTRYQLYHFMAPTLPTAFFPHAQTIYQSLAITVKEQAYWESLLLTVERTITAFGLSALLGILAALVTAQVRFLASLCHYPAEFFRQLSAVIIIPLAMLVFGLGTPHILNALRS